MSLSSDYLCKMRYFFWNVHESKCNLILFILFEKLGSWWWQIMLLFTEEVQCSNTEFRFLGTWYYDCCFCCCLVAKLCLTLCNSMDCSPPDSFVLGIPREEYWEWVAISFSRSIPDPRIEPTSPALSGRFFTIELPGKPVLWLQWPC